jgi:hypothetical protein
MERSILILLLAVLSACNTPINHYKTDRILLRQLVKTTEITKSASASYFLILGTASYSEESKTTIKVMGKVHGLYRLIEFDFNDARIKIDNSINKPYLYLKYTGSKKVSLGELITHPNWYIVTSYVIVCPEKYLPEKLLPINL